MDNTCDKTTVWKLYHVRQMHDVMYQVAYTYVRTGKTWRGTIFSNTRNQQHNNVVEVTNTDQGHEYVRTLKY